MNWNDASDTDVTSTLYWRYTGSAPTAAACANLATVLSNTIGAEAGLWTEDTVLTGCTVTDLATADGLEGSATANFPGEDTSGPIAGGTATLINFQIARRYRGGKPRNYFPWGSSARLMSRQSWSAAYVSEVASAWSTITSTFIGTTESGTTISNHANVSYYEGFTSVQNPVTKRYRNVPSYRTPPISDVITGFTVSSVPGSQRRRNK